MLVQGSVFLSAFSVLVFELVAEFKVSCVLVLAVALVLVAVLTVKDDSWFEALVLLLELELVLVTVTKLGRMSLTAMPAEALRLPKVAVTEPRPPLFATKVPSLSIVPIAVSTDQTNPG